MSVSREFFEKDGPMARELEGYEIRPQQLEMVQAVEEAIEGDRNLIVEAGTGVGKSLAYLVPFIMWAAREKRKVVVSTYTKALQNQLYVKDLPFLKRVLGVDFSYEICMGSENYACLKKAQRNGQRKLFDSKSKKAQMEKISNWLTRTETGLMTDMDFVPDRAIWQKFSREADMCLGKKCSYSERCFYRMARSRQQQAHVLVTNHSLLFTDMMSEARVLPEFHGLVLDEAHTLEDVATGHFGRDVSNFGLKNLAGEISRLASSSLVAEKGAEERVRDEISEVNTRLKEFNASYGRFFDEAEKIFGRDERVIGFNREDFFHEDITRPLVALSFSLMVLSRDLAEPEEREQAHAYAEKCDRYAEALDFIFAHQNDDYVYWIEVKTRKRSTNYSFHAAPIDISGQMRELLFERISPVVLTSATLVCSSSGRADFSFIETRLGLDDPLELALDSPFDYANKVLMYMPREIADPNSDFASYREQALGNIIDIYDIMGGRIFALFTSYDMLFWTAGELADRRSQMNILKQGDLPRYVLLDVFKKNPDSILLGTTTFWQGVDVPGSSLECVIITKLPFTVPSDPINAARIQSVRDNGQNPFTEYQLPQAIIMFKQGFGRLIRGHSDRGVVAVLDPRIRTRFYGREFINALPRCRRTDDLAQIRDFFAVTGL
ncbi:MAG: DEAD/DEAH box helicase [Candidatus Omnitrophica bacterium]|nr:DEAD/DEAH box helicase [Candidatus Omnitrophota bacterium]